MAFSSSAVTPLRDSEEGGAKRTTQPEAQTKESAFLAQSRILAVALNNIGAVHQAMGRHPQALESYQRAVKVRMDFIREGEGAGVDAVKVSDRTVEEVNRSASAAAREEERLLGELRRERGGTAGMGTGTHSASSQAAVLDLYPAADRDDADDDQGDVVPDALYSEPLHIAHRRATSRSDEPGGTSTSAGLGARSADADDAASDHRESAVTLHNMGLIHATNGSVDKATQLFNMAKSIVKPATDPTLTACILNNLAQIKYQSRDPAEAIKILQKALQLEQAAFAEQRRVSPTSPPPIPSPVNVEACIVATLSLMGRLHYEHGDATKALELGRETLRIRRASLGDHHIDVACSLLNIGLTLHKLGNPNDALEHCRWFADRVASLASTGAHVLSPAASAQIGTALHNVGMLHLENDRVTTAVKTLEQALAVRRAALGPYHPDVADSLYHVGQILQDTGRDREAMDAYREAARIFRSTCGPDHEDVAVVLCNMGQVHQGRGELDEALAVYGEVLRIARLVFGTEDEFVAEVLGIIGNVYLELGDTDAAMARFADSSRMLGRIRLGQGPNDDAQQPIVVPTLAGFRFHPHAAAA